MRVKMLQKQIGSPDGIRIVTYEKGEEYDLPKPLATIFTEQNWAEKPNSSNSGSTPHPRQTSVPEYDKITADKIKAQLEGWGVVGPYPDDKKPLYELLVEEATKREASADN